MILEKTFKTMFTKPLILLMSAAISIVPVLMGALLGDISGDAINGTNTYNMTIFLFTAIMILLFVGPLATYTYEVCNDSKSADWFKKRAG